MTFKPDWSDDDLKDDNAKEEDNEFGCSLGVGFWVLCVIPAVIWFLVFVVYPIVRLWLGL